MYKKLLGVFLTGTFFLLCSCVDDTYDLSEKEINTDIEFKGEKLAFPLGDLKAFVLDSLMRDIDMMETEDGVFAVKEGDSIHPLEKMINPISLEIEDQHIELKGLKQSLAPSVSRKVGQSLSFHFEEKTSSFFFEDEIDRQIKRIKSLTFEPIRIELKVNMDALNNLTTTESHLDLTLEFPECFKNLECNEEGVTPKGNIVTIKNKKYSKGGLVITLYTSEADFKNSSDDNQGLIPTEVNGQYLLSYSETLRASGDLSINIDDSDISQFDNINQQGLDMGIECSFSEIKVKTFKGIYYDDFDVEKTFPIDLGDKLDFLKDNGSSITLADPQIEVILYSTISFPTNVKLEIIGKDKEGNEIKETEIIIKDPIPLKAATRNAEGEVVPVKNRLLITKEDQPNLGRILEFMPDSMTLYVRPVIDETETHDVDIERKLDISAKYNVILPLVFEELNIEYNDTIALNLGETLSSVDNADIMIKMNVANTIPLDLKLKFIPLDKENNIIKEIPTMTKDIKSGNGGNIHKSNPEKQSVELTLSNENATLEKLKLDITAATNGSVAGLKSNQGLKISNIAVEVTGDISIK